MISEVPEKYELSIGYSWHERANQGICGHLFEMIEYYHILSKHINTCMMVCEDMSWERMERTIRDKYDFTDVEIQDMKDNTIFFDRPWVVKGNALLLVDGNFSGMSNRVIGFKHIMAFACRDRKYQTMNNVTVFHDDRIYGEFPNTKNYIKKILFSRYKGIGRSEKNNLIYATSNARRLDIPTYQELEKTYEGPFLLLSDEIVKGVSDRFVQVEMPVKNLFERFDRFIYTRTEINSDCSSRFIAECKFYGKDVEYFQIDYIDRDFGLCFRKYDIEDNFKGLFLKENDPIVGLVDEVLYNRNTRM